MQGQILEIVRTPTCLSAMEAATIVVTRQDSAICGRFVRLQSLPKGVTHSEKDSNVQIQGPPINRALVNRSNQIIVQHYPCPEWAIL